eukprot:gene13632-13747_t
MPLFLEVRQIAGNAVQSSGQTRLESGQLVIGRGEEADLRINNPFVSRKHCTIAGNGAAWQIADHSSTGTMLNGQRLQGPQPLHHGDVIALGDIQIAVRIEAGAPLAQPVAGAALLNLDSWGQPAASPAPVQATATAFTAPHPSAAPQSAAPTLDVLLQAAGLPRGSVPLDDAALARALGMIVRAALAGMAGLAQERQAAHRDLKLADSAATNPVLSGGAPEAVLARLLALPGTGASDALAAATAAITAHQRAALGAWQGTFAATLDHFAPDAILQRASGDAAAWQAYARAFAGRDGFVETFAQEFARHYKAAADTK